MLGAVLAAFPNIQRLRLTGPLDFSVLPRFKHLRTLSLDTCPYTSQLSDLQRLTALQSLHLKNCAARTRDGVTISFVPASVRTLFLGLVLETQYSSRENLFSDCQNALRFLTGVRQLEIWSEHLPFPTAVSYLTQLDFLSVHGQRVTGERALDSLAPLQLLHHLSLSLPAAPRDPFPALYSLTSLSLSSKSDSRISCTMFRTVCSLPLLRSLHLLPVQSIYEEGDQLDDEPSSVVTEITRLTTLTSLHWTLCGLEEIHLAMIAEHLTCMRELALFWEVDHPCESIVPLSTLRSLESLTLDPVILRESDLLSLQHLRLLKTLSFRAASRTGHLTLSNLQKVLRSLVHANAVTIGLDLSAEQKAYLTKQFSYVRFFR